MCEPQTAAMQMACLAEWLARESFEPEPETKCSFRSAAQGSKSGACCFHRISVTMLLEDGAALLLQIKGRSMF